VLGGLCAVGAADGAGQLGVDPVPRLHQQGRPVEQPGRAQGVEVVGGERVQGRQQLAHHTSECFRSGVRSLPAREPRHYLNPQVRDLSTDLRTALTVPTKPPFRAPPDQLSSSSQDERG
jgi:hypothetical protein